MKIIDISPRVSPSIAVWPGDVPFSRDVALDMNSGDNLTLSAMTATLHLGAHTDAPSHYVTEGADIASRPLERYYGPAQVIEVDVARGARIVPGDLKSPVTAPRVLLKTDTYNDPNTFNEDFAALSPELVEHLADHGVVLVGIDTPSVDLFSDKELLSHNAIARHDLAILEGIVLGHVEPGLFTLIALPLPLVGCDASPVRAALVSP
jgi:arylformamidase